MFLRRQTKAFIVRPPPQSFLRLAVALSFFAALAPLDASAYQLKRTASGAPVAWAMDAMPLHVFVTTEDVSSDERALLEGSLASAIDAWNGASGLELVFDRGAAPAGTAMHAIVVRWDKRRWDTHAEQLAITSLAFEPSSGVIEGAVVRVNDAFPWAPLTATPGALGAGGYDLQGTLTHELGHAIGLAHSDVASATMHLGAIAGEQGKRTLDPDDVEALEVLYGPPGVPRVVEASAGCADVAVTAHVLPGSLALVLGALALFGARLSRARARSR